VFEDDLEI
jgi:hypothetical protein